MHAKSSLVVVLIGLLGAMDACAAGDRQTASIETLPDGSKVASTAGKTKTCKVGDVPLATGVRTSVTTTRATKVYPRGGVFCFDPANFGGRPVLTVTDVGVVVTPAVPAKP